MRRGFGLCLVLACLLHAAAAQTATGVRGDGKSFWARMVVKLRPEMAARVERLLSMRELSLASPPAQDSAVAAFMARHSVRKMSPVHSGMVRLKKQRQWSGSELAAEMRRRYPARAARMRAAFDPPDLSRTYVLDLGELPAELRTQVLARLQADPAVEYAEEDRIVSVQGSSTVNDPYFWSAHTWGQTYDDLWGIKKIGADAAWQWSTGAGVVVAVVDTGIDYYHPDIAANIWHNPKEIAGNGLDDDGNGYVDDVQGWDFVGQHYWLPVQGNAPMDGFGHGTHVAGIIAAVGNNGIGVVGVAYQAQVMPVKALDDSGQGADSQLAAAITYAADNGADVINLSWGGPQDSQALTDAVEYAYQLGVVLVAAAGNSADDANLYTPANLPQVITVAASDPYDQIATFSNSGDKIDVAAPGVDILSLRADGTTMGAPLANDPGYTRASGTSMAAPHASGAAALVLSRHPDYTAEDVRQALRATASDLGAPGFDNSFGYGQVSAAGAAALSNVLRVQILSPGAGASISQATPVMGLAQGTQFVRYDLEYGVGDSPTQWTLFASGATPTNGELGSFDPGALSNGKYSIRLTAIDTYGTRFVDRVAVNVVLAQITYPVVPPATTSASTFKAGIDLELKGLATGNAFRSYDIAWAPGLNASSGWTSDQVTLANGGTSPALGGTIGFWQTPADVSAGFYTVRMLVHYADHDDEERTIVYLDPDLTNANWPRWLDRGPEQDAGLTPFTDAGGGITLAGVAPWHLDDKSRYHPGELWWISGDGAQASSIDLDTGNPHPPAVADLDPAPGEEFVIGDGEYIRIFRADHSQSTIQVAPDYWVFSDAVQIDGASSSSDHNILAEAMVMSRPTGSANLYAFRQNGTPLGDYPVNLAYFSPMNSNQARFLVGDFNADGWREVLVQELVSNTGFNLKLYDLVGSPLPWNPPPFAGFSHGMVAADLDHNGALETLVAHYLVDSQVEQFDLLGPDGRERPGWPKTLTCALSCDPHFAFGDLNHDGVEEIVIAFGKQLYVFEPDGTSLPGFPVTTNGINFNAVVIGDVDGDGFQEIVTSDTSDEPTTDPFFHYKGCAREVLLVYDHTGTRIRQWLLTGGNGYDVLGPPVPAIGDFNGDGNTEILVTYRLVGLAVPGHPFLSAGMVTMYSTSARYFALANDWPLQFQNPRNVPILQRENVFAAPDFLFPVVPPTMIVSAGQPAHATIELSGMSGFVGSISLSCTSGLPTSASCSFSPSAVMVGNAAPVKSTLTVQTTHRTVAGGGSRAWVLFACFGFPFGMLLPHGWKKSRGQFAAALLVMILAAAFLGVALIGCGGGAGGGTTGGGLPGTPPGTYTVVVTATSGHLAHTLNLTLVVN